MASISTMITNSLIMTGEKSIGGTLTSSEQDYFLSRLNSMMDSWSNEGMLIYSHQVTNFPLTTSKGVYTIGVGGDFDMPRPIEVLDPCFIRDSNNFDREIRIIDEIAYGRLPLKFVDGTYPSYLFYDGGFSATSTANIKLWAEPQAGLTLFINTTQQLQTFSTVSVNLNLPPGYQRAIETNFAIETAPGFITLEKEIIKLAKDSKAAIKGTNTLRPVMRLDYGIVRGVYTNILTGP